MSAPSTKISWLKLEQYALGELSEAEAREVQSAIAHDEETAACWVHIGSNDVSLRPLPRPSSVARAQRPTWLQRWRGRLALAAVPAAVAAAAVLTVRVDETGVKGDGAPILRLAMQRGGRAQFDPERVATGSTLSLWVTCSPPRSLRYRVVVVDESGASSPLSPGTVDCGNQRRISGGLVFDTAGAAKVCVVDQAHAEWASLSFDEKRADIVCEPIEVVDPVESP